MPFPVRSRGSIPARKVFLPYGDPLCSGRQGPAGRHRGLEKRTWRPPLALCHLRVYRALRKESDISQESGYGFELTFRLKRGAEEQPPAWPVNLLQNLARYVFSTGNGFGPGHHMSCNGPIALDTDTKLTALGFRVDPELGELDTPNGHMRFLQAVALTGDEMEAMMCWDGQRFLEELERCIPLCLTDLKRVSQMGQAAFSEAWKAGVERDGSSVGVLYLDEVEAQLEDGCGYLRLGAGRAPLRPACFGRGWERGGICVCTAGTAQSAFVPVCGRCWRGKTVS